MNYSEICEVAGRIFQVEPSSILEGSRTPDVVYARHAIYWALYEHHRSFKRVSIIAKCDHTTVIHGRNKTIKRMASQEFKDRCHWLLFELFKVQLTPEEDQIAQGIRLLAQESSVKSLKPSFWPEAKYLEDEVVRIARQSVRGLDPYKIRLQPVEVKAAGHRWIVRFESVIDHGRAMFKHMDTERVF